jgi:hypothetical protein
MHAHDKALKDNKSIAILDAAERGGYGIIAVCCVSLIRLSQAELSDPSLYILSLIPG